MKVVYAFRGQLKSSPSIEDAWSEKRKDKSRKAADVSMRRHSNQAFGISKSAITG
jgi:hypothetical protein